jgi:hypothetical protein
VTLGESLSPEMRARMAQLRDDLQRRAEETVKTQLAQPKAPWQVRVAPTKAAIGAPPKSAPVKSRDGAAAKPKGLLSLPVSTQRPRLTSPSRSNTPVSKPESQPFRYWELPPEAPVRELPPKSISVQNQHAFEALLAAGVAALPSSSGEEVFATIGLDFGTSTTKVIVRFPYEPGAPAIAIPAPAHCQSMGHPYLWQTVLWLDESGAFTAWPPERAHLLHALKQGIMGRPADAAIAASAATGLSVTRTEAAAAFLALVVRYTRGWLLTHRAQMFRNRRLVWFLNVGMPVANIDDGPLVSAYRRAAAAATLLGNLEGPITVERTRLFLADPHVLGAARSPAEAERLGIAVLPETAAEAAGFAKSTNRAPGLYLMIDVGAMTLDVCTFRLSERASATDLYALCVAQVRPLGVEAYHWFLGQGKTESEFVEQCDRCIREVVWGTKTRKDPYAECWQTGNELPVFVAGGGANNPLHRRIVESLKPWLRQHAQNEGVRLLELPIPTNIDLPVGVSDFGRLAVAWGLSYPPSEIGEIFSPSAVKDKPPPIAIDWTERFTGKELV